MNSNSDTPTIDPGRRNFLKNILPASFLCLGCKNLFAQAQSKETQPPVSEPGKDKFLEDSGMSYLEVFAIAFQYYYIPVMKQLAEQLGKEKFLEMLKKASSDATAESTKKMAQAFPSVDLTMMAMVYKTNSLFQHALCYDTIEQTHNVLELKVHECLWAKTFREVDAGDIGFAAICYSDYAQASAFNPKIKMIRSKTLMEGHEYCNHRYVMEG